MHPDARHAQVLQAREGRQAGGLAAKLHAAQAQLSELRQVQRQGQLKQSDGALNGLAMECLLLQAPYVCEHKGHWETGACAWAGVSACSMHANGAHLYGRVHAQRSL